MERLFLAINLPAALREKIAAEAKQLLGRLSARLIPAENLHLSLVFIGPTDQRPTLRALLPPLVASCPSFFLSLGHFSIFQKRWGNILWLSLKENPTLNDLQKHLVAGLKKAGFHLRNESFTPHITVGRQVKGKLSFDSRTSVSGDFKVESLDLMQSELGVKGSRYKVLARFPLKG